MKNGIVLALLCAALLGGAGLWWSKSSHATQEAGLAAPKDSGAPRQSGREDTRLEASGTNQRGDLAAQQPAKVEPPPARQAPVETPPPLKPIELADSSAPAPVEVGTSTDPDNFEELWSGAKQPELQAAYKAQNELYQMNREGRVTDKSQMLTGEALERLGREVAWLKEKAFGGG